ncbi:MAG: hypothetical protein ACRDQ0_18085 [Pseudonocardia sp.]
MLPTSRTRVALIGALVATVLATAGCTTTLDGTADPAPTPTEGPGSDPVAWAGRVCEAVLSYAVPATSAPDYASSGDLPAVQRTFSNYLGGVVTGAQQGKAQLAEIGQAPEPTGDEVVTRTTSELEGLAQDFTDVKTEVDKVDANNPDAFMTTLVRAESTMNAITPPNPIGQLGSPRLQRAAERAEPCRQLTTLATTIPR